MDFQSPILSGSDPTVTGRLNMPRRLRPSNIGASSLASPALSTSISRRHSRTPFTLDDNEMTTYHLDSDPTFTR